MKLIPFHDLDFAVHAVEAGELVVLPTRRWYMICANARDSEVCGQIFAAKGRPRSKSMAYVLPHFTAADELFVMTSPAQRLASAFWPGDLALILRWRDMTLGQQHESVGVPHALVTLDPGPLGELARRSRVPIAATTVNISSDAGPEAPGPAIATSQVQRFVADTGIDVAFCVDGGLCPLAHHLTIVDCTAGEAVLVRPGIVHERAIVAALTDCSPPLP